MIFLYACVLENVVARDNRVRFLICDEHVSPRCGSHKRGYDIAILDARLVRAEVYRFGF